MKQKIELAENKRSPDKEAGEAWAFTRYRRRTKRCRKCRRGERNLKRKR